MRAKTLPFSALPKMPKTAKPPKVRSVAANPRNIRNACWVYTLNNYTDEQEAYYRSLHLANKQVVYHVFGKEVGKKGTRHLQGFIVFTNTKLMSTVKNVLVGNPHLESARGTNQEASTYCKKDGKVFEYGELPADKLQGKRNDLDEVKEKLDGGATLTDIARENFVPFVKFYRGFQKYQAITVGQRNHKTQVMVITGTPRTFKSYSLARVQRGYHVVRPTASGGGCWYDGYDSNAHDAVILDDFNGGWMPYHNLLELTDRYACQVQTKGGTVQFRPIVLGLSSNTPADTWYPSMDFSALDGRIELHFTHLRCDAPDDAKGLVAGDIVVTCLKGNIRHHPLFEWMTPCGEDMDANPEYKLGLDFQLDMAEKDMPEDVKDQFWELVYQEESMDLDDALELSDDLQASVKLEKQSISSEEEYNASSGVEEIDEMEYADAYDMYQ